MSTPGIPHWRVPHTPEAWPAGDFLESWPWGRLQAFPRFLLADGSGPALQQTRLRAAWNRHGLYVRFDCEDRDAWGTFERRDDPLYEEEVVEVFLAPGEDDPTSYFEFEVSPRGAVFDAVIHNPHSRRSDMRIETAWDCPGLRWTAGSGRERQDWWAALAIPWAGLLPQRRPGDSLPERWRANFYRIERPREGVTELSAWSPTLTHPPDFHRPARFGALELSGASRSRKTEDALER